MSVVAQDSRDAYGTQGRSMLLVAMLVLLLWPLAYAVWLSFTPGEFLEPPRGEWSLRWYREFFGSARWMAGLSNSVIVAAMSTVLSLLAGVSLAMGLSGHRFAGAGLAGRVVLLPLLMPPVVLAMALLPLMRLLGLWGSTLSLAIGHSLLSLPVVYIVIRDAIAAADPDIAVAARGLGASRWLTFRAVVLPLLWPAITFAALASFVLSLNEFVIALFLATPAIETLPKVIWPNLRYTLTPLVAAASAITVAFSAATIAAVLAIRYWMIAPQPSPNTRMLMMQPEVRQ